MSMTPRRPGLFTEMGTSTSDWSTLMNNPGVIVAVDSGSQTQESFRGNVRNAYQGIAYALVRATGPGTITLTASANGLALGTTTLTGTTAPFVPCSGSCN